jgi:hypothetical protein
MEGGGIFLPQGECQLLGYEDSDMEGAGDEGTLCCTRKFGMEALREYDSFSTVKF